MTETRRGVVTVSLDRARGIMLDTSLPVGSEVTGIVNALGRTLAEAVATEHDVPPLATAARQGYAAIAADTVGATSESPRLLSVLASSVHPLRQITPGTVVPVGPGDPLPPGADTVIDSANAYRPTDDPQVNVMAESAPGCNVRAAGTFASAGEVVIPKGTVIASREMGLLASLGRHGVRVSRKPRISIATTGAGIVDTVEETRPGEQRNSARYALVGMVLESGCDLGGLTHIREGRVGLERAMGNGRWDALIVALGPSDKHDLAVAALRSAGEVGFERIGCSPCSASAFGAVNGKPVFIVPSEWVLEAFEAVIRPGLLAMLGRAVLDRPSVQAKLRSTLRLNPGYRHYVRAITAFQSGDYVTKPIVPGTAGARPWTQPDSLIVVPENTESVRRGDSVHVMLLD